MQYLTIVNRTSNALTGTWDGRQYTLPPGKSAFPEVMARKFKDQHPLMGSENPHTLEKQYLIGIEGEDPCEPLEQSDAPDLTDWKVLGVTKGQIHVRKSQGLYTKRDAPLPKDTTFVPA